MRRELIDWLRFLAAEGHVISEFPELIWQQAVNRPAGTLVARRAAGLVARGDGPDRPWLRWLNRPAEEAGLKMSIAHPLEMVTALAVAPDGARIAAAGTGKEVCLWEAVSGQEIGRLAAGEAFWKAIAFSRDGTHLLTWASGELRLWRLLSLGESVLLVRDEESFPALGLTAGGRVFFRGRSEGRLQGWDLRAGRSLPAIAVGDQIRGIAAPAERGSLAVATDEDLLLLDERAGAMTRISGVAAAGGAGPAVPLAASADGLRVATGATGGAIAVWDTTTRRGPLILAGHPGEEAPVAPGLASQVARLEADGHRVQVAGYTSPRVTALATGSNPRLLASGGEDGRIKLWDLEDGRHLGTCEGHSGGVWCLAFLSPDTLVSAGRDVHVKVWSV